MILAKTDAAGGGQLLPSVLAFTSSLPLDVRLLEEDLLGSLAHVRMLGQQRILADADARLLQRELLQLRQDARAGRWTPSGEEDVHMAVEAELHRRLGVPAGLLHTARSRNDQVSLDLRLHVREQVRLVLLSLGSLLECLIGLAERHRETLLPGYTHRQRAQPISFAYWLCGYGAMLVRDAQAFRWVHESANLLPLGVGAIAGTSLPIDREETRRLLRFAGLTDNGLDTVGDRDFALDFTYACARCSLHLSRLATDVIDFASQEFGFLRLGDAIACGSSMMPHKRNPDLFELVRGKSGAAVGALVSLLVTVKGLPGGYNRDFQEDRRPLLESGPQLLAMLDVLTQGFLHVEVDAGRCLAALEPGDTQATDLAEALVHQGVPFREAYQAVGTLVARCHSAGIPLCAAPSAMALSIHPLFKPEVLAEASPQRSVQRKVSAGGTGAESVQAQLARLRGWAGELAGGALSIPSLEVLFRELSQGVL